MEFLGIGPLELLLIVLLILIIFGPKEMEKMGKSLGQNLNKLVKSDLWKDIRKTSETVRDLPTQLMRNAEMEELAKSLQQPLEETPKILPEKTNPAGLPPAQNEAAEVSPVVQKTPPDSDHP